MCGIVGYWLFEPEQGADRLHGMLTAIRRRGPDDEGIALFDTRGGTRQDLVTNASAAGLTITDRVGEAQAIPHDLAFGHRRFSIIDLSPRGHQPFWSHDRGVCVSFNGEIYNYEELRDDLRRSGREFRTDSDTEVLAEAYLQHGTDCFRHLNGIWALSLYDVRTRRLVLSRDRVGKIPLYYARTREGLFWASEIKGLFAAIDRAKFSIDEQSVTDFVLSGVRDRDHRTFYEGIRCLPSASWAEVDEDRSLHPQRFWSVPEGRRAEAGVSVQEAAEELKPLLRDAVRIRMRSDVPVGFELSGGMDSSSLVALGAAERESIETYTVSFPGTSADEEPFAREVAGMLGGRVRHHVLYPTDDDFFEAADWFVDLMGEPIHSPNMLTNHQIWRQMHAAGIRVCINGGGGDELFAGYGGDYFAPFVRHLLGRGRFVTAVLEWCRYTERPSLRPSVATAVRLIRRVRSLVPPALGGRAWIPESVDPFVRPSGVEPWAGVNGDLSARLIQDVTHAKMNYWLASDNQSYMGIPVELRLPFLDYRVLEFAFRLPVTYLIRDGWLKWILREAMRSELPDDVVWRRHKMGLPFPLREWLPASRERFLSVVDGLDCPYLNLDRLGRSYGALAKRDPKRLWREMSLALWWKRCVLGESLAPG